MFVILFYFYFNSQYLRNQQDEHLEELMDITGRLHSHALTAQSQIAKQNKFVLRFLYYMSGYWMIWMRILKEKLKE